MIIQFNTDKIIRGSEGVVAPYVDQIEDELNRFSSQLTRIEIHLSDENGLKDGMNDIRCMMEARLEGKQPVTVTNQADTIDQSITGAIDKLKALLETIIGKERNY